MSPVKNVAEAVAPVVAPLPLLRDELLALLPLLALLLVEWGWDALGDARRALYTNALPIIVAVTARAFTEEDALHRIGGRARETFCNNDGHQEDWG